MRSGENVKAFFRRVAAITFEQAILRELESQGARIGAPQIGSGGVLSKYVHVFDFFTLCQYAWKGAELADRKYILS